MEDESNPHNHIENSNRTPAAIMGNKNKKNKLHGVKGSNTMKPQK